MEEILNNYVYSNLTLDEEKFSQYKEDLDSSRSQLKDLRKKVLYLEMLINYNELKRKGLDNNTIQKYYKEDMEFINNSEKFVKEQLSLRDRMFGYPTYMKLFSPVEKYLRELETELYIINNCGDSDPKKRGNFRMDSKESEMNIISLFCKNMNVDPKDYWGYVSSGGTESNFWAIRNGFQLFPKGKLYYFSNAHYSVPKSVKIIDNDILPNEKIIYSKDNKENMNNLIQRCNINWKEKKQPAIIVLTWGSTSYGQCDNYPTLKSELDKLGIPNYIHLDAACSGGIPRNQKEAPAIKDLKSLNVDSVSISFHKYIGSPKINGIVLCKKEIYEKTKKINIEYIGQDDPTFLGSRDFEPLFAEYRIKTLYERSDENEFITNVKFFQDELIKNDIPFERCSNGNTFVISLPNKEFAKKYQLATFENDKKAHIIIYPSHKKEIIIELVRDLKFGYK